jgi:hypothetical protein
MKIYCDRLAEVQTNQVGQCECPKCNGICQPVPLERRRRPLMQFNCTRCGRGWTQVPDECKTVADAEKWEMAEEEKRFKMTYARQQIKKHGITEPDFVLEIMQEVAHKIDTIETIEIERLVKEWADAQK